MWHNANMPARPVQISLDTDLLARIDADPEVRKRGRSVFIRSTVETYLFARRRRDVDSRIASAYDGCADEMLEEIAELFGEQQWPPAAGYARPRLRRIASADRERLRP